MDLEKTVAETTNEELETFADIVKYSHFEKWLNTLDTEEAKKNLETISQHTGQKIGSPLLMLITAFFAGIDAGVEIMEGLNKAEA